MYGDLVFQSALVGAMAVARNVYLEGYDLMSTHLWMDSVLQMVAKFISAGVTEEFVLPIGAPVVGQYARVVDPILQGSLVGAIKGSVIDSETLGSLGLVATGAAPPPAYFTFESGFIEGLLYGGIATGVSAVTGL